MLFFVIACVNVVHIDQQVQLLTITPTELHNTYQRDKHFLLSLSHSHMHAHIHIDTLDTLSTCLMIRLWLLQDLYKVPGRLRHTRCLQMLNLMTVSHTDTAITCLVPPTWRQDVDRQAVTCKDILAEILTHFGSARGRMSTSRYLASR